MLKTNYNINRVFLVHDKKHNQLKINKLSVK